MEIGRRDMLKISAAAAVTPGGGAASLAAAAGELPLGIRWDWVMKLLNMDLKRGSQAFDAWAGLRSAWHTGHSELASFSEDIARGDVSGLGEYVKNIMYEINRRNYLSDSATNAFFLAAKNPNCRIGKMVKDYADTITFKPDNPSYIITRGDEATRQAVRGQMDGIIAELAGEQPDKVRSLTLWMFDMAGHDMAHERDGHPSRQDWLVAEQKKDDGTLEKNLVRFYLKQLAGHGLSEVVLESRLAQVEEAISRAIRLGREAAAADVNELVEATKHYTETPANPSALRTYDLLAALGLVEDTTPPFDPEGRLATGRRQALKRDHVSRQLGG